MIIRAGHSVFPIYVEFGYVYNGRFFITKGIVRHTISSSVRDKIKSTLFKIL
jgi:hypothetical protein